MKILKQCVGLLSSFGLACVLLILLLLLTWLGTLEQGEHGLYATQKKYFESVFLVHHLFNTVPIPLPGGYLVMGLLTLNLLVGGLLRLRWRKSILGVALCHIGIVFMMVAGFVTYEYSSSGHLTLYEGQRGSEFQSYTDWELTIAGPHTSMAGDGTPVIERAIPGEHILDLAGGKARTFTAEDLPFDLVVDRYMPSAQPLPKGPMFEVDVPVIDGFWLRERNMAPEAERNMAGAYVTVVPKDGGSPQQGILWGGERYPFSVDIGGQAYTLVLDKKRWPLPFTVVLDDFKHSYHPGTRMPASFESDITKIEGGHERKVNISMNQPLRDQGYVLYQASWGPQGGMPGDKNLFSTFAVVKNPSDQWPLYSCIIIAVGLLIQFGQKLLVHLKVTASKRS